MNQIIKQELAIGLFGISARAFGVVADDATGRIYNQCIGASKQYMEGEETYRITVDLRFDDNCKNGHETFSITGSIDQLKGRTYKEHSCGCIHDEIAKHFPALAHLIKWHLVSTDGPMHYIANTIYHAGDKDHNGLRKGETRQIRNGRTNELCWILQAANGQPLHALDKYFDGDAPPDAPGLVYAPWLRVGEGKARELDHARSSACWPDATDDELTAPGLEDRLKTRLPALMEAFRADMLACGFLWPEPVAALAA
jgi:hypothetical protein